MARNWCGFAAQNMEVKEQWGVLEQSRSEIEARLGALTQDLEEDGPDPDEDTMFIEAS